MRSTVSDSHPVRPVQPHRTVPEEQVEAARGAVRVAARQASPEDPEVGAGTPVQALLVDALQVGGVDDQLYAVEPGEFAQLVGGEGGVLGTAPPDDPDVRDR